MPDEVFMTVVEPRPLFVRATLEEKDFANVRGGLKGQGGADAVAGLEASRESGQDLCHPGGGWHL